MNRERTTRLTSFPNPEFKKVGQPTAENPKGREPLILKESQKEVDPLFLRKKGKNGNFEWKAKKECDKISCRRITYKELKQI